MHLQHAVIVYDTSHSICVQLQRQDNHSYFFERKIKTKTNVWQRHKRWNNVTSYNSLLMWMTSTWIVFLLTSIFVTRGNQGDWNLPISLFFCVTGSACFQQGLRHTGKIHQEIIEAETLLLHYSYWTQQFASACYKWEEDRNVNCSWWLSNKVRGREMVFYFKIEQSW